MSGTTGLLLVMTIAVVGVIVPLVIFALCQTRSAAKEVVDHGILIADRRETAAEKKQLRDERTPLAEPGDL
jgi:hypothetical protein